jgi:polar amino acid transport system substrate-binding protein
MQASNSACFDEYAMRFLTLVYLIVSSLACLGATTSTAHAQSPDNATGITEIIVCTQEWAGDTNEDMTGFYWDTLHAVFDPVGIKFDATFMPYKVSIAQIQAKKCDMALSGYLDEYSDMLYTQWPQELEEVVAIHAKGTSFSNQRSFVGKKSAWLKGYGFQQFLTVEIDFTEVRSEALGLRMLEQKRIDYFVDYEATIKKAAKETGFDLSNYKFSPVTSFSNLIHHMFRKDDRGATLVGLYNRRMAELYKDGTLDQIFEKHKKGRYPAPSGY